MKRGRLGAPEMPYQFDFNSKNRILRGRLTDRVDDDELADYYRVAMLLSHSLHPHAGITDLSPAVVSVSSQTIETLAKLPPANIPSFCGSQQAVIHKRIQSRRKDTLGQSTCREEIGHSRPKFRLTGDLRLLL